MKLLKLLCVAGFVGTAYAVVGEAEIEAWKPVEITNKAELAKTYEDAQARQEAAERELELAKQRDDKESEVRAEAQKTQAEIDLNIAAKFDYEARIKKAKEGNNVDLAESMQSSLDVVNRNLSAKEQQLTSLMNNLSQFTSAASADVGKKIDSFDVTNFDSLLSKKSNVTSAVQQELESMARGTSAIMDGVAYKTYLEQRDALVKMQARLQEVAAKDPRANKLLNDVRTRIREINAWEGYRTPTPPEKLTLAVELDLSNKIPSDRILLLKNKLGEFSGLSVGEQLELVDQVRAARDFYNLKDDVLNQKIAAVADQGKLVVEALKESKNPIKTIDEGLARAKQGNYEQEIKYLSALESGLRSVESTSKDIIEKAQLADRKERVGRRLSQIKEIMSGRSVRPAEESELGKRLALSGKIPEDRFALLSDYFAEVAGRTDQELPTKESESALLKKYEDILDTANRYGLASEPAYKNLLDSVEAKISDSKKMLADLSKPIDLSAKQIVVDIAVEAAQDAQEAVKAQVEQAVESTKAAVGGAAEKLSTKALEVGEKALKTGKTLKNIPKLIEKTEKITNEVLLAKEQLSMARAAIAATAPEAAKVLDSVIGLVEIANDITSDPNMKTVKKAFNVAGDIATSAGQKIIATSDAVQEISDALTPEKIDEDADFKARFDAKNSDDARRAFFQDTALKIATERDRLFEKAPKGYVERLVEPVKSMFKKMGEWFKDEYMKVTKGNLADAQKAYDSSRVIFIRSLGLNPKNATPETIKAAMAALKDSNPQKLDKLLADFTKAGENMRSVVDAYALRLDAAEVALAGSVQAWDAQLVVDENSSVLDLIGNAFEMRAKKMAYIQAMKDNMQVLKDELSFAKGTPVETMNTDFIDRVANLVNSEMVKTAVDSKQMVDAVQKQIDITVKLLDEQIKEKEVEEKAKSAEKLPQEGKKKQKSTDFFQTKSPLALN